MAMHWIGMVVMAPIGRSHSIGLGPHSNLMVAIEWGHQNKLILVGLEVPKGLSYQLHGVGVGGPLSIRRLFFEGYLVESGLWRLS